MNKNFQRFLRGSFLLLLLGLGTGCNDDWMEIFRNEKRMVSRQVVIYQAKLSKGEFQEAAQFHSPSFKWTKDGHTYERGATSAFLKSIEDIRPRTAVILHVTGVKKLSGGNFLISCDFQVRAVSAVEHTNTQWSGSMIWTRQGKDEWHLMALKELTERRFSKS